MLPWGWLFHSYLNINPTISPRALSLQITGIPFLLWKITGLEVSLGVFSWDLGLNYGYLAFVVGRWPLGNKGKWTIEGESPKWAKWWASSAPLGFESVKTWVQRPLSDFLFCKAWHNRKSQKLLSPKPCTCHISLNSYAMKLLLIFFLFYRKNLFL